MGGKGREGKRGRGRREKGKKGKGITGMGRNSSYFKRFKRYLKRLCPSS